VLSTISGIPCDPASAAMRSMSRIAPRGFPIVSPYSARVFGVMAASQSPILDGSTNRTPIENF